MDNQRGDVMVTTAPKTGYAPVNGLELYYEIHGIGQPLVLLHGGLDTIDTCFGTLLPALAESRHVVAVELQGHGHTADVDRPLRYEQLADDIAALIEHLGLERAGLFGFSLGGGVALQAAIRHPHLVRRLVVASAPCRRDGWYPEILAGIASLDPDDLVGSPWQEAYARIAPRPEDWPTLIAKVSQVVAQADYDWAESVPAIKAPTLLIFGDADSVSPAHAVEMFGLLGGGKADGGMGGLPTSRLAILPGTVHLTLTSQVDLLTSIVQPFLDAPLPGAA